MTIHVYELCHVGIGTHLLVEVWSPWSLQPAVQYVTISLYWLYSHYQSIGTITIMVTILHVSGILYCLVANSIFPVVLTCIYIQI